MDWRTSPCVNIRDQKSRTDLCWPGCTCIPQSIYTGPLDIDVSEENSKLELQKSVKLEKVKWLSAFMHMQGEGSRLVSIVFVGPTLLA